MTAKSKIILLIALVATLLSGCTGFATNKQLQAVFDQIGLEAEQTDHGVVIFIPEVYFDYNKADLNSSAQEKIEKMSSVLNDSAVKPRKILVEGHTDSVGSDKFNQRLSIQRANAVKQRLIFEHVSADRITAVGYGEKYPVAHNSNADGSDSAIGRAKNRRVEILVKNPPAMP
ncbi:MAG: OmpA family protein [Methylococcaceae bacterium]|nr:OmpA family protein [Methylococcaceae bacterium]